MATAGWKESMRSRVQAALVRGCWHLDLTVLENEAKVRPRSRVKETKSLNNVQGREMKLYLGLGDEQINRAAKCEVSPCSSQRPY